MTKPRVTLFDLDHTLLPIDSDYSWGEFTQQIGWTDPVEFKRRNDAFYQHYIAGTLDVHDYVRFAVEALRTRGPAAWWLRTSPSAAGRSGRIHSCMKRAWASR